MKHLKHLRNMTMLGSVFAALTATLTTTTASAQTIGNLTVGGDARAQAMGGAGIATGGAGRANPGSLAFATGVGLGLPSIGLRTGGALNNINKLSTVQTFISNNGTKEKGDAAKKLAKEFAGSDSSVGFNTQLGLRFGPLEVSAGGVAQGKITPDAALRNWATTNNPNPPVGASADVAAVALYSLPSVGFGMQLPAKTIKMGGLEKQMKIGVGARVKYMNAAYTRYTATTIASDGTSQAVAGPELGGATYVSKKGLAADLGAVAKWDGSNGAHLTAGIVATNFIKPALTFNGAGGTTFDPQVSRVSAGGSFEQKGLLIVGDIANLTGGGSDLRFGAEKKLGPLALRGGYSSKRGTTYGLGIFGIDIAFGKGQPLELVQTLRF
jgi:hypothetical protein